MSPTASIPSRVRRLVYSARTEGIGAGREAAAIGLGVFIGATPFFGFHFLICMAVGTVFGLNRLKLYIAANISNPLVAPFLIFSELQTGALVRRGQFHALTLDAVRTTDPWRFAGDLLTGSVIVGGGLGILAALGTYALAREPEGDRFFLDLVRRASDRFIVASITAWEFARGKLRGDPLYRTTVLGTVLPGGRTLVDVGCGSGLTLALLIEAETAVREGRWPGDLPSPPIYEHLLGIEKRPRVARHARAALGDRVEIVDGDVRDVLPPHCDAALFFDVLHMLDPDGQAAVLAAVAAGLAPGGVVLVREADAAAGWRFRAVRAGNRLKAVAFGHWRQTFHFRTAQDWTAFFHAQGFSVEVCPMGQGTPFGNVLLVLRPVTHFHLKVEATEHEVTEHDATEHEATEHEATAGSSDHGER